MFYDAHFFIEKRIVIKDSEYNEVNGKTCIITHTEYNDNSELVLHTDLDHPESYKKKLTIGIDQIAYIKEYDYYLVQYMDWHNRPVTFQHEPTTDYKRVGTFDVYKKVFPPFN
jgi:hypothetical protein